MHGGEGSAAGRGRENSKKELKKTTKRGSEKQLPFFSRKIAPNGSESAILKKEKETEKKAQKKQPMGAMKMDTNSYSILDYFGMANTVCEVLQDGGFHAIPVHMLDRPREDRLVIYVEPPKGAEGAEYLKIEADMLFELANGQGIEAAVECAESKAKKWKEDGWKEVSE